MSKLNHYDTDNRIRCRPKQVMQRDRLVLIHGEPACLSTKGVTTVDESRINCPACLAMQWSK